MGFMPRIRLFIDHPLSALDCLTLDRDQSHYVATVMRQKEGDRIAVFNGVHGEWWAKISSATRKAVTLTLEEQLKEQRTEPDIWLAFAPIKSARTDFIVEKATELGVARLIPTKTERTNAARIREDRLKSIAIEAAEQCERLTIPSVAPYQSLSAVLQDWPDHRPLFFADEMLEGKDLSGLASKVSRATPCGLLVGPEGGFTKQEREKIISHKAVIPCHLGPRILRADTATLAGLSLLQAAIGDWGQPCPL